MSLAIIKSGLVSLCIDVYDGELPPDIKERVESLRRQIIKSPDWIQKTEYLQIRVLEQLFNLPMADFYETRWRINRADGFLDEALRIDREEREKGIPKAIDRTPDVQGDLLEDSINLENWLLYHGEGVIGPSWWMDNSEKDEDSWAPVEVMGLNKALQKRDGVLVEGDHVFRFMGRGSFDCGKWITSSEGPEYLFGVFTLENDPRPVSVEELFDINLERWLEVYGEEAHPARMMCPTEGRKELIALNKQLKVLDGTLVGDTHVWRYAGKLTYKREGKIDLFKYVSR